MSTMSFASRLALVTAALLVATAGGAVVGTSPASAGDTFTVVDGLGPATPATKFDVFGSSGPSILGTQFVGPQFTLTETTVLTEIGGFVNNCKSILAGVPQCSATAPFTVQIRPRVNGVPDPSTVLATFVLSHDNDPLVVSYESVEPNVILEAGSYYVLFAPQNDDAGWLLASASSPFSYLAGVIPAGTVLPTSGTSSASSEFMAVRILGRSPRAAELLANLEKIVTGVGPGTRLADIVKRAQRRLAEREFEDTCETLGSFIDVVRRQTGKTIPAEQAATLIASAREINASLGC